MRMAYAFQKSLLKRSSTRRTWNRHFVTTMQVLLLSRQADAHCAAECELHSPQRVGKAPVLDTSLWRRIQTARLSPFFLPTCKEALQQSFAIQRLDYL